MHLIYTRVHVAVTRFACSSTWGRMECCKYKHALLNCIIINYTSTLAIIHVDVYAGNFNVFTKKQVFIYLFLPSTTRFTILY